MPAGSKISPPPPEEQHLTIAYMAAALAVPDEAVYDEIHAGNLPAIRIGRRLRVQRMAFESYLQAHAV